MVNGVIAVIIAYLLGAICSAYIITRLLTGKDIRQLGGGNGLSVTIDVLSLLLTRELLIILSLMLLLAVITRNPVLSLNISLLSLPVSAWSLEKSRWLLTFSLVLLLILVLDFLPTTRAALVKAVDKT